MAEEVKNEEEENNTFGAFDNKYAKGIGATVLAAIVAKNDPYLLQGFQEKIDELEKADRARRDKFIETATKTATEEIARNKLKRLARREKIEPEIKRAVENGLNPIIAGKAYKAGHLPTLMKLKLRDASLDLNSLYKVAGEYPNVGGEYSTTDIIEALAGPTLKLNQSFDNLKAPRSINPLRNFLGTGDDTSAQEEIKQRVGAVETSDDYKTIDYGGIEVSDLGKRALASMQKTRNITSNQIKSNFTRNLANALGIKSGITSSGEYVFNSDDKVNEGYGMTIQSQMSKEVEDLITKEFMSPADAQKQVFDKYFNTTDDGLKLDMSIVGSKGLNILPKGWTPADPKGGNTGSGAKNKGAGNTGKVTPKSLLDSWNKTRKDLLERYGSNKNNTAYKNQLRLQGNSVKKQYEVLGGNPDDINTAP
jgi:hypothetical protein